MSMKVINDKILQFPLALLFALMLSAPMTAQQGNRTVYENALLGGVQQYEDGQVQKAAATFEAILKKAPDDDAAHYYLAVCHIAMNNADEAELHLSRAVALDSANFWYRQRLAMIYAATQRNEQAISLYESILRDFPKKTDTYYALLELYSAADRFDDAIAVLDKIDTLSGGSEATVVPRFRLMYQQGREAEAYACLEKADDEFESPQIKAMLGDYQLSQYNIEAALALYDEALALAPGYTAAVLGKAEAYRMMRRYDDFFTIMEEFISDRDIPEDGKCQYLQALVQRMDPRMMKTCGERVERLVSLCVEVCPDNVEAAKTDCMLRGGSGNLEELADAAHRYVARFPEDKDFLDLAMYADYNLERYDSVLVLTGKKYERAKASGDKAAAVEAYSSLGDIYHQLGQSRKAYRIYKEVLKMDPDHLMTLNNYAYFLSEEGRSLGKALKMSARVVEEQPDNATYLDTYGWILHLKKKDVEALSVFKRAMMYGGKESAVVLRHYADVLDANGKKDLAEMYRSQADAREKKK